MEKTYERINWENYPSVVTPINEKNLNKMDQALDEVDNRVIGLYTAKLDKSIANTMIKDLDVDEITGIFTITYLNGTVKKVDTGLEKIATNFKYNKDTQKLVLTLTDGTEQEVDLSSLISQYEFTDSDTIAFTIGADGKVSATIKAGSITEEMLQPNFLADVKVEVEKAKNHSNSASNSSNEAKQYRDEAEQFRNEASLFVPEGYDELVQTVEENTVKIDTLLEKAGLEFNNTTKGSNIHLTDSAESNVVSLELYGKTEQNTYTGKNLLDCSGLSETTSNGVTFTPVYDDNGNLLYINANGTATNGNASFNIKSDDYALSSGTYILSGCPIGGDLYTYRLGTNIDGSGTNKYDVGNGLTIDLSEDKVEKSIWINVFNGKTVSNLKFYPMISIEGGEYEPYVGGKPSPSPSYPQELKSVVLNTIKTHGKNLLDLEAVTKNSTFDASGLINTSSVSSITDFILVSGKENVTISNARNDTYTRIACYYDVNKSFISSEEYSSKKHTFTVPSNAYYMRITVGANIENVQAEIGVEATEYEPYQSSEITLSEPIELNGLNGVYDVVTSEGVTRKFGKVVFDGSDDEAWSLITANGGNQFAISISDNGTREFMCTHFVNSGVTNWGNVPDGTYMVHPTIFTNIRFRYDAITSVADFKMWLTENPMTVVYELATPTTEAMQNDFTALKTFYPETYVSNDADCDMSVTYLADAKNYIDNKLALLEMALFNNI